MLELLKTQINKINIKIKSFQAKIFFFHSVLEKGYRWNEHSEKHLIFSEDFEALLLNFSNLFENRLELLYCQTGDRLKDHKQKGDKKDCIFLHSCHVSHGFSCAFKVSVTFDI